MLDRYTLLLRDEELGKLQIDVECDLWEFEAFANKHDKLPYYIKHGFDGMKYAGENVKHWVTSRAPEPNYEWIDLLLDRLGISKYDAYAFFKYNGGRFNTDRYSVRAESGE